MKFKKLIFYMLVNIIFLYSTSALSDDKKLIVIASDNIKIISLEAISNLYTFRQKLMPNSQRAQLTSMPLNSEDSIDFTQKFFKYYPYQLKRIWDQAIFSGKARRPKQFDTSDELLIFIKDNDNAIGYILIKTSEILKVKETYNVIAIIN
jgi:hypothetical protein